MDVSKKARIFQMKIDDFWVRSASPTIIILLQQQTIQQQPTIAMKDMCFLRNACVDAARLKNQRRVRTSHSRIS